MTVDAMARTVIIGCDQATVVHGTGEARVTALDGVSVDVHERDRLGLWGPSGCGKTTLLHVLGGLVSPTGGHVTWETSPNRSVRASSGMPAPGIGFVFQQPNLLPYFTARENVQFAARAAGRRERDVADDLLTLVGLAAKVDFLPGELSGGEQQRVSIARALAQEPQVLLCDEPTGRLDTDTAHRVLDLVDRLQTSLGFALVVASHDPTVIARLGREIHLVDGRIVDGTVGL